MLALITETTNASISGKTPSEKIAKDLVWDVLIGTEESKSGVMVTTFSSHIARIRAIIEAAHKMGQKAGASGPVHGEVLGHGCADGLCQAGRGDGLRQKESRWTKP